MEKKEITLDELIQDTVSELLSRMGFSCEIELVREQDAEQERENLVCNIKTEESNFLIGQYGVNLQSLQHLVRVLVRKKTEERINFILDVNSYRKDKNSSIVTLAKNIAEQAVRERRTITLRPMSPYERRLVHMELSKNTNIKTESIGDGDERRVVVRPANTI